MGWSVAGVFVVSSVGGWRETPERQLGNALRLSTHRHGKCSKQSSLLRCAINVFMPICTRCNKSQPASEFSPDRRKKSGLQARCKTCCNQWQKENPEFSRKWFFQKKYGITIGQYELMHKEQDGKCACCGQPEYRRDHRTNKLRLLCVDHDHGTGRVRALLCDDCNVAVGRMKELPERAMMLYNYLTKQAK